MGIKQEHVTYPNRAILDTSSLLCLYHLGLLSNLRLVYDEVRLPAEVRAEFLRKPPSEEEKSRRFNFLELFLLENESWFVFCDEYGQDLVDLWITVEGLDKGEAEALAQNQFYDNLYQVIIDETDARKKAKSQNIEIRGTLTILAILDQRFSLCDYFESVKRLKAEINSRFGANIIKVAYQKVKDELEQGLL